MAKLTPQCCIIYNIMYNFCETLLQFCVLNYVCTHSGICIHTGTSQGKCFEMKFNILLRIIAVFHYLYNVYNKLLKIYLLLLLLCNYTCFVRWFFSCFAEIKMYLHYIENKIFRFISLL